MSGAGAPALEQEGTVEGYRHEAVLYAGEAGFVEAVGPFVAGAVEADEPVLVAVSPARADALRAHLGEAAAAVCFADMERVGANPARLVAFWHGFVADHAGSGRALRGVGEPLWPGRLPAEVRECELHEALLNVAVDPASPLWLRCPYDAEGLSEEVLQAAKRNHPHLVRGATSEPSDAYARLDAEVALAAPLPPAPVGAMRVGFDACSLGELRGLVAERARKAGIAEGRVKDAVLVADEVATNSVRHGGGSGTVRTWTEGETFVVEVADGGRLRDPLVGRLLPPVCHQGGRGLFIANQLADLVQVRSDDSGTLVRLHVRR